MATSTPPKPSLRPGSFNLDKASPSQGFPLSLALALLGSLMGFALLMAATIAWSRGWSPTVATPDVSQWIHEVTRSISSWFNAPSSSPAATPAPELTDTTTVPVKESVEAAHRVANATVPFATSFAENGSLATVMRISGLALIAIGALNAVVRQKLGTGMLAVMQGIALVTMPSMLSSIFGA